MRESAIRSSLKVNARALFVTIAWMVARAADKPAVGGAGRPDPVRPVAPVSVAAGDGVRPR
jgi:hypothetical protein